MRFNEKGFLWYNTLDMESDLMNNDIRSRKKDNRNKVEIKKVDVSASRNRASKESVSDSLEATKKLEKKSFLAKDNVSESKGIVSTKKDSTKDNEKKVEKINSGGEEKMPKAKKEKVKTGFWFRKLSRVGQLMLIIYLAMACVFGFFLIRSLMNRGQVIYGDRTLPTHIITPEQVEQVKTALQENIEADNISVELRAFRLIVVMDLPDDISVRNATRANNQAMDIINGILPIDEYFSSTDQLNNDLFVYSADIVPTDYDTTSRFIIETYKNSRMSAPSTHNLLEARDDASRDQVLESFRAATEAAGGE